MDLNKIGQLIHDLRTEKGMSQTKLAEMIPITRQAVSRWEQGKSLPDSQTLIILSEIFEISIDEILAGKRNAPEEKSKITLDLVDEYNNKKRTIKKITITSVLIICLLLILFFGYYFFNSYNSIKVYTVNGVGKEFFSYDGIMITTKQKTYLRIGEIESKTTERKIESVRLYFLDDNGQERILYKDSKTDILITSYYGYGNNFSEIELKQMIKGIYLEIEYEGKKETIKLQVKKDFSNNLWFYNKKDKVSNDNNERISMPAIHDKIKLSMEEKGNKDGENYRYEIKEEGKKITFLSIDTELYIEVEEGETKEEWSCFFSNEFSFIYARSRNGLEEDKKTVIINNEKNNSEEEQKIYTKLTDYINKYILNQE